MFVQFKGTMSLRIGDVRQVDGFGGEIIRPNTASRSCAVQICLGYRTPECFAGATFKLRTLLRDC